MACKPKPISTPQEKEPSSSAKITNLWGKKKEKKERNKHTLGINHKHVEKEAETGSKHARGSCLDQQQQNVNSKTPRSPKHQEAKAPSHLTELHSGKLAHLNGHFFFRAATPRPTSPPRARAAPPTMAMPIKPSETARGFQYSIRWSWLLEHYTGRYDRFTFLKIFCCGILCIKK